VQVTEGFLPTLAVNPALGRLFAPEEDLPGASPVAILSDGLWRSMFGADPSIVGQTIFVNATATTVVGVLPAEFRHIEERTDRRAEIFTPYRFERIDANRGGHFIRAVGRLAPESTVEEARSELSTIATRLEREYPESNTGQGVHLQPLHAAVVGDAGNTLLILLGAAGLVLLVACANLGTLLLAVGASRERELAVRSTLGAGRRRLVRQLLTECLVLGLIGGAGGLLAASATTGLLTRLSAAGIPRAGDITLDPLVLTFGALVAIVASLVFGMLPALSLSSGDVQSALAKGGRQGVGVVGRRSREVLIAAEVALSVVLVAGAGLLVGTLLNLRNVSTGFEPTQAITMEVAPPTARYPEGTQTPLQQELEARARAIPGIISIGGVNILPLTDNYDSRGIYVDGRPLPSPGENPSPQARTVTPGYFDAMGIPLVRGRLFDSRDQSGSSLVAVVSQSLADQLWPGEDPIGHRFTYNSGIPDEALSAACPDLEFTYQCIGGPGSREVVGVVGDVKHLDLREADPIAMFYTPNSQTPSYHAMIFVVRTRTEPTAIVASMRAALAEIDPEVPLAQVRTLDDVLSFAVAQPTVRAGLIGMFAVLAVALAWIGVYGVVGYLVTRRRQEIGIRMALGAPAARLLGMLARDGIRPVAIGILVGLPAALVLSRVLESLLFGVSHLHPGVYLIAAFALAAAGLLATLLPVRRALRLDPAIALSEG
jgi:predicted permease